MSSTRSGVDELDPMQQIEKEVDSVYTGTHDPTGEPVHGPLGDLDTGDHDPPHWRGPTK
jgi:hypothetical protein